MKKTRLLLILFLASALLCVFADNVFAAVGCDLNDPDRDVKRLFPVSTGYKTEYLSIDKLGGQSLLKEVETRLGDNFQGLYETIDVPYTVYTIYKGKETIGYIHGINQKGTYGGLQVFLGYDTRGNITNFYYQKLTSKASDMRSSGFAKQFVGLSLSDFKDYDPKTGKSGNQRVTAIKNPNTESAADFNSTLRAVKKNLILMDIFVFNKKEAGK
ncbi:MAG: hypothetical protein LBT84_07145 [Spirochaetia bacterium]|jgi:hypothetical protein|nr:hypothetical protein [Spirochaetia bacterium]